jgi:hypothetical protein
VYAPGCVIFIKKRSRPGKTPTPNVGFGVGPLPSAKYKCHIHNSLDAKIAAVEFTMANVAFISIFYGSITLRLAKVIGVLPVLAVYVAAYPD